MVQGFIQDLGVMVWKELKEFFAGGGGRGRYIGVIMLGVFGVILPLYFSAAMPPAVMPLVGIGLYGLYLPVILILSVGADSFAGERERHTLETLLASRLPDLAIYFGKLLAVTIFGWAQSMLAAIVALVVIAIANAGALSALSVTSALAAAGFGLLTSLMGAAATSLVSLRAATVRQAQQILTIGLVVIVFGSTFGLQAFLPHQRFALLQAVAGSSVAAIGMEVAALVAVLDVVLILWAVALFRRAKLILSGS